jgi:hypothetical protein
LATLDLHCRIARIASGLTPATHQILTVIARGYRGENGGKLMDSTGGPSMPNPEECRHNAKLCVHLANTADDKIERATLLQIANQWRRLANYRVKRERQKTLSN